jgi:hypothetical protein
MFDATTPGRTRGQRDVCSGAKLRAGKARAVVKTGTSLENAR